MPSRLSSLLVRDGLVGVKRMEKAFQRQVIYGGSLDTILLEMNLLPEERLIQYLALASGLPPAARDEGSQIQAAAVELIPREIAEQFRAVPLAIEGEAIRLLVCSPLEITELEDLADILDRPLQPLIGPEYRWHLVFSAAYGLDPPARFTTLARQLEVDATPIAVGRARSVIIEDGSPTRHAAARVTPDPNLTIPLVPSPPIVPAAVAAAPSATAARAIAPVAPEQPTMKMPAIVEPPDAATPEHIRNRSVTLMGVTPNRASTDSSPVVIVNPSAVPRPFSDSSPAKHPSAPNKTASRRSQSVPIDTVGRDSPLAIVRARELLATAEDRDTVFLTLLRAARSRARYAGLLTVQGGAAIGRVALAETGIDTSGIANVLIPLDSVSPFRSVVTNHQPHIGSLVSGDPGIDSMVMRLGGTMPPSALILPVSLRDRVVAIVIAHRVHSDLKLVDITELLPLAGAAADALGRLIVRHKAAGYRAPADKAIVEIEADMIDTKRIARPDAEWRSPGPSERPSVPTLEQATELSFVAEPPRDIEEVLDEIERAKEGEAEDAMADAVERAGETLRQLVRRFPGRLRLDRFAITGRPLRAAQYGGLLELVIRLGSVASELLVEKMSSPQRDVRFYATVCCAELRPRNATFALVERVFDQDFGVRASALEALAGYPVADLSHALARARRAVHSTDPDVVIAATAAMVALGDIDAIPDLIGALERGDRGSEHVRRALVALTAQDYGINERKWRKWWETSRKRHRIEWLIEGLGHKEDAIRESAINDLRRLTGEYFGYHHDLPRKEREGAAVRWASWWQDVGRRRFEQQDDERNRPTGLLPVQRRDA
jgi:hypothetical protein